jgi:antitoxin YefM
MTNSEISYTEAQRNLGVLLDSLPERLRQRVADDKDIIVIQRNGKSKNVALIAEEDLSSLMETVYLLRSPANAARLYGAIDRAKKRDLEGYLDQKANDPAQSIAQLCEDLGIVREKQ